MSSISPYQLPLFAQRRCSDCGETKLLDEAYFPRERRQTNGFSYRCKDCSNKRSRAWRRKNREYARTFQHEYRMANREKMLARERRYHEQHREEQRLYAERRRRERGVPLRSRLPEEERARRRREAGKRWRQRHPEKVKSMHQAWRDRHPEWIETYARPYYRAHYKANPSAHKDHARNRRALKRRAEGTHTTADLDGIFAAQAGLCAYCAIPLVKPIHVDHKIPLSRGGSNGPENLCLACASCNLHKHCKTDVEYRALLARRAASLE